MFLVGHCDSCTKIQIDGFEYSSKETIANNRKKISLRRLLEIFNGDNSD